MIEYKTKLQVILNGDLLSVDKLALIFSWAGKEQVLYVSIPISPCDISERNGLQLLDMLQAKIEQAKHTIEAVTERYDKEELPHIDEGN